MDDDANAQRHADAYGERHQFANPHSDGASEPLEHAHRFLDPDADTDGNRKPHGDSDKYGHRVGQSDVHPDGVCYGERNTDTQCYPDVDFELDSRMRFVTTASALPMAVPRVSIISKFNSFR